MRIELPGASADADGAAHSDHIGLPRGDLPDGRGVDMGEPYLGTC